MEFLYPTFLFALVAVAIPIVVHLYNFRRSKKILFPNVKFIEAVQERTRSHSQLKHLLVLLCRILAIAALVLAFARPFLPAEGGTTAAGRKAVSFYLNNAFTMDAEAENGRLLDIAKERIRQMAEAYDETDHFQLLTNDLEGRHQRLVSLSEFLDLLDEVETSPFQRKMSEIMLRQKDALTPSQAATKRAFLVGDMQRELVDVEGWQNDSNLNITLVPIQSGSGANLYIDSIWFTEPVRQLDHPDRLHVRIKNTGSEDALQRPVYMHINGEQRALASFSVAAESSVDTSLAFTNTRAGLQQGKVSFADHPIAFDDVMFFSYDVAASISVLEINADGESALNAIFQDGGPYQLSTQSVNALDPSAVERSNLVVLHGLDQIPSGTVQQLKTFQDKGGSILLFPGTDADLNGALAQLGANALLNVDTQRTKVVEVDLHSPLFKDLLEREDEHMDMPKVMRHYRFQRSNIAQRDIMSLQNGAPFLSSYGPENRLYVASVPLNPEWSSLTRHAFFVAIVLRAAELSTPSGRLYYAIGSKDPVLVQHDGNSTLHLTQNEQFDMIPEVRRQGDQSALFIHNGVRKAGNYTLSDDVGQIGGVSFNYPRQASALDPMDENELSSELERHGLEHIGVLNVQDKPITASLINELNEGQQLWRWCIILALIFLGLETALIRFWK